MESFGTRLKRLRMGQGLSVAEISRKIGVPASTYREWEYGRSIKGEPYLALSTALNVSLYELFTGTKPDPTAILQAAERIENEVRNLQRSLLAIAGSKS